jgi:3-hydroxybutyryl-CoA dehydrogenase
VSEGRIAVIGAGTMGSQIAQQIALHGYSVSLYDERPEQLTRALESNRGHLQRRVEKGALTPLEFDAALARVEPFDRLEAAIEESTLIIEAIVEDLGAKQALFQQLDDLTDAEVMLATNSSSMTVSQIASILSGRDRVIALHFFNPVLVMQLVEIAPAPFTRSGFVQRAVDFVSSIDRTPVVLEKEIEGLLARSHRSGHRAGPSTPDGALQARRLQRFGCRAGDSTTPLRKNRQRS